MERRNGLICISNIPKNQKELVLKAIAESGQTFINWDDQPDSACSDQSYGSVWSSPSRPDDLTPFWNVLKRLRTEAEQSD